jgi:NAD(P)-dependent dehydrogenase (short-subunit alcohol dehydrogenase family)
MDLGLSGKIAVVTAASKGIGLAIVKALSAEGAYVVAGARDIASLEGLERVTPMAVDLATAQGPGDLVARAIEQHGRVDVLVNNMGAVRLRMNGFLAISDEEFEWALQMNFFASLRATRAAITRMVAQGGGAIVNVSSVNAFFQPDGGTIDYGAAKAALANLTKSLSQEFGPRGIRINDVAPGPVSTDLWLGAGGVAETVGKAMGVDPETARKKVV